MMNNAFRSVARSTLLMSQRQMSSKVKPGTLAFLDYGKHRTFKKMWLSDVSTYPIVFVLGFAVILCGGVGLTGLTSNPDVRVDPSKRNTVIRTWGIE